jgi:hypothetical protein
MHVTFAEAVNTTWHSSVLFILLWKLLDSILVAFDPYSFYKQHVPSPGGEALTSGSDRGVQLKQTTNGYGKGPKTYPLR